MSQSFVVVRDGPHHQNELDNFEVQIKNLWKIKKDRPHDPLVYLHGEAARYRDLYILCISLFHLDVNVIIERLAELNINLNQLYLKHIEINEAQRIKYDTHSSLLAELHEIMSNIDDILGVHQYH
jgi:hypothetical protein